MNKIREHGFYLYTFLSCLLTVLAVLAEWKNPLRWIVVSSFLLFGPGLSFHRIVPGRNLPTRLFLIVILSLAVDIAVAQIFLFLGKWSPPMILLVLVGICGSGLLWDFFSQRFHQNQENG